MSLTSKMSSPSRPPLSVQTTNSSSNESSPTTSPNRNRRRRSQSPAIRRASSANKDSPISVVNPSSTFPTTPQTPPSAEKNEAPVQVVVRLRPINEEEKRYGTLPVVTASSKEKTVTVVKGQGHRQSKMNYSFNNVFASFSSQEEVFQATLLPVIGDVMQGYESTVFAYGQVSVHSIRFFVRIKQSLLHFSCSPSPILPNPCESLPGKFHERGDY